MELLHTLACPMPKGMLAFVVAVVWGFFRVYADTPPSSYYPKFFLWLLAIVAGGAALAYFPLVHFCAA